MLLTNQVTNEDQLTTNQVRVATCCRNQPKTLISSLEPYLKALGIRASSLIIIQPPDSPMHETLAAFLAFLDLLPCYWNLKKKYAILVSREAR